MHDNKPKVEQSVPSCLIFFGDLTREKVLNYVEYVKAILFTVLVSLGPVLLMCYMNPGEVGGLSETQTVLQIGHCLGVVY